MKIYALSGASGTGKSTSALAFAHKHQIEAIIDDGLLIINGRRVAGTSAKFEKNTVTAVRRAIFTDAEHASNVRQAIADNNIQSIVLIGTSQKMTRRIAQALELGEITKFINIEEIRSENAIRRAQYVRITEGKHVMPVPYHEVEQNFFKRLIKRGWEIFTIKREKIGETTMVYPDFHQDSIQVHKRVYTNLVRHVLVQQDFIYKIEHLQMDLKKQANVEVVFSIKSPVKATLLQQVAEAQQAINDAFYQMFGFTFDAIDCKILRVL